MWKTAARTLAIVVSAPLFVSVFDLWRRHIDLLPPAWKTHSIMPISTGLIGLGIGIGIIASTFALTCSLDRCRILWIALTLLASSLIVFGFLLRDAALGGPSQSWFALVALFAFGALLAVSSAVLVLRALPH
ncbi:MAG: hypothetical protein QHI38_08990 [Armatimonadota bacterium]|nr:hypothetical protein [Armatimonadota bacterium]